MKQKQIEDIVEQLETISKLMCLNLVKDEDKEDDKVNLLYSFGFKPSQIANLLNKKRNSIDQSLHRIRKKQNTAPVEEKK